MEDTEEFCLDRGDVDVGEVGPEGASRMSSVSTAGVTSPLTTCTSPFDGDIMLAACSESVELTGDIGDCAMVGRADEGCTGEVTTARLETDSSTRDASAVGCTLPDASVASVE